MAHVAPVSMFQVDSPLSGHNLGTNMNKRHTSNHELEAPASLPTLCNPPFLLGEGAGQKCEAQTQRVHNLILQYTYTTSYILVPIPVDLWVCISIYSISLNPEQEPKPSSDPEIRRALHPSFNPKASQFRH